MNLRILLLFLAFSVTSHIAFPSHVPEEIAKTIAFNFIKNVDSRVNSSSLSLVDTRTGAFYIFGYEDGWVIISSDDRMMPILGYSTEGAFPEDTIRGENFWGQMKSYENQIKYIVENNISATYDIYSQWQNLINDQGMRGMTTIVPPLLTTTWDQGWPYNSMCPSDASGPGGHVWAGCVATAMAQILKYHNYPNQGLGSYGYQWGSYPYTGADFGTTTYNWSNMPNSISMVNNDIATIIYQTAVSCRSMWGAGSTGVGYSSDSDPMTRAWVNYFKAAFSTIHYVESQYYTTTEWNNLIQAELTNNRPVYYRGDGIGSHAWVCDGVDASNMYHFNWGWGGSYNGYFALTAINPGGFNFTSNQHAIIGIKPNDGSTLVSNTTWSGNVTKSTNIAVPDAITLTVNPGAIASFAQNCKLQIWGKLTSIGTSGSYVKFTAVDTTTGWLGIKWNNDYMNREVMADNDSSKLIYTQVEYSDEHGILCRKYGKVIVNHCKINNNDAGIWNVSTAQTNGFGGGIFVSYEPINITNSEIYNNHTMGQGGGFYVSFTDNLVSTISQNDIYDNLSDIAGGGYGFYSVNNILFTTNTIHHNQAIQGSGGFLQFSNMTLINNKFCNNSTIGSVGKGGGLYLESCSTKIIDNLFANNTRNGLYITTNSNPMLINNTISNNSTTGDGGGIRIMYNSNPTFKNTILYGNTAPSGSQISLETTDSDPFFDHCDVQGGVAGFGGVGAGSNYNVANYTNNIDLAPQYVSPSTGAGTGYDGLNANWQLQSTSPCINAGDTTGVSNLLPALDLGGNPRINSIIDMGAYEACSGPAQPSTITGATAPCQGSSQIYGVSNVSGVTYTWTVPTGSTITNGQGSNSITVTIGSTSGNISVTPSNTCGSGTARTLAITVNSVPAQPSTITGSISPCLGSSQVYAVSNISGVTYTWTVPTGWSITNGQNSNSITVTVGSSSGNISVTPSNGCGNGTARTLAVTVSTVPAQPSTISGSASPCQGSSQAYSVTNVSDVTYTWTVPAGWSIPNGQNSNSITVTVGSSSGNISVTPSNSCGNGTAQILPVTVNYVTANAGSDQTIQYGTSTLLNGVASNGSGSYTYHWEPASMLVNPNIQNPVTINLTSLVQFALTVTDGVSGCTGSDQVLITVTGEQLSVDATATPSTVCAGDSVQLMAIVSGGSGNYTYSWNSNPSGFNSTIANPVVYPTISTTYTVVVNDGFNNISDWVSVTVNPLPETPTTPTGPDTVDVANTSSSIYTTTVSATASSYVWELLPVNAGVISGNDFTGIVTWNQSYLGLAHIRVKAVNSCGESWSPEKLTMVDNSTGIVKPEPPISMIIYPNPTSGEFTIVLTGTSAANKARASTYTQLGEKITELMIDSESTTIPSLSGRPAGVYLIRIETGQQVKTGKIVKL